MSCVMGRPKAEVVALAICVCGNPDTPWLLLYIQPNVVQLPKEDNNSQEYTQNVCYTAQCKALTVSGV